MTESGSNRTEELVERLFGATVGTLELFGVYLGVRLGLYEALREHGPLSSDELASAAGIAPRYAREWCEQQAVSGLLDVDEGLRFSLPPEHVGPLVDGTDLDHVAPFALLLAGIARVLPEVAEAYRSGGGVPFESYGDDLRSGQGAINRPAFLKLLPTEWIPAIPGMKERLEGDPPARVADIGAGQGWASIGIASAYPRARVVGFDTDDASVRDARSNARAAGVEDRVQFVRVDASSLEPEEKFDLVCMLEMLHDVAHPVGVLQSGREMLAPGGLILVADERVADNFSAPGDEIERMMYGWSITHCLPAAMTEEGSAATGTVMRSDLVKEYASSAGLSHFEILDIDNPFFRFYALAP